MSAHDEEKRNMEDWKRVEEIVANTVTLACPNTYAASRAGTIAEVVVMSLRKRFVIDRRTNKRRLQEYAREALQSVATGANIWARLQAHRALGRLLPPGERGR